MLDQFLKHSAELASKGEAFALATVVRCQPPSSGKPGDKAIIYADGKLKGWIGGGCAQPVVIREALKALVDGKPRLVRISPDVGSGEEGIVDYTMTCHSGGSLDIYIEPILPGPHIVVLGRSPVAQALARLGRTAGYMVSVVAPELGEEDYADAALIQVKDFSLSQVRITPQTFIVVSTQGENDEEALEQATGSGAGYIAFVASKTKAAKVFDHLRKSGVAEEKVRQVRAPAGLDLGATTPKEIAVSILAEIVKTRQALNSTREKPFAQAPRPLIREAKDPICGMTVDVNLTRHKSEFEGRWFYFCCAGCKQKFDREPAKHAALARL
jgi:xanthine dehydrogenase accessory factor